MAFTPIEKQSKKAQKEYHAKRRQMNGFNTGTRDHETEKHPTREMRKRADRRLLKDYENS